MTISIMDGWNGNLEIVAEELSEGNKRYAHYLTLSFKEEAASMTVKELYDTCIDALSEIALDEKSPLM